jgi:hypothetical protein
VFLVANSVGPDFSALDPNSDLALSHSAVWFPEGSSLGAAQLAALADADSDSGVVGLAAPGLTSFQRVEVDAAGWAVQQALPAFPFCRLSPALAHR